MSPRLTSSSTSAPAARAVGDHPLEDGDAAAAEALVERRLRLDHRRRAARPPRPRRARTRSRPATSSVRPHCGEQPGVRVDAGAELAARRRAAAWRRVAEGHGWSLVWRCSRGSWPGRATSRRAVVGSCSRAVPTWTAAAPASRNGADVVGGRRCRRGDDGRVGQGGDDLGRRSAARAAGSPGRSARRGGRRASRRAARCRRPPRRRRRRARRGRVSTTRSRSGRSLASTGRPRGRSRWTAATTVAAWNGSRTSKHRCRPRRRAPSRLTSIPATPGERPSRRASSAYSPSERPATETNDPGALLHQPRAARWRGSGRGRGSAGRRRGPAPTGSRRSAARGRRRGARRDRAGDEAAEVGEGAVRRQLAAGAAAAGGDQHRGAESGRDGVERHAAPASWSQRDPVAAEDRAVGAGAHQPCARRPRPRPAPAQPWQQAGGAGERPLERDLAPGAGALGGRGDRVQGRGAGRRRRRPRRRERCSTSSTTSATVPRWPTEPSPVTTVTARAERRASSAESRCASSRARDQQASPRSRARAAARRAGRAAPRRSPRRPARTARAPGAARTAGRAGR